jgi:hypothetical protein
MSRAQKWATVLVATQMAPSGPNVPPVGGGIILKWPKTKKKKKKTSNMGHALLVGHSAKLARLAPCARHARTRSAITRRQCVSD